MYSPFRPLNDKLFLRLYLSQTIRLLGDAFTWVGIALLAFQFGGEYSAAILSAALTLRVTAFYTFSGRCLSIASPDKIIVNGDWLVSLQTQFKIIQNFTRSFKENY